MKIAEIQFHLTEYLRSFDNLFGIRGRITRFITNEYFDMQKSEDFISSLKSLIYDTEMWMDKETEVVLKSMMKITSEIERYGDYNFRLLEY